eukprot:GHVU01057993.1.p2 GENE.GHVU01057993.1~~GHVU01057993.1.p2  ORF type:complete len:160 (-),score=16.93 GHVU01057993.1:1115-1594(-)
MCLIEGGAASNQDASGHKTDESVRLTRATEQMGISSTERNGGGWKKAGRLQVRHRRSARERQRPTEIQTRRPSARATTTVRKREEAAARNRGEPAARKREEPAVSKRGNDRHQRLSKLYEGTAQQPRWGLRASTTFRANTSSPPSGHGHVLPAAGNRTY